MQQMQSHLTVRRGQLPTQLVFHVTIHTNGMHVVMRGRSKCTVMVTKFKGVVIIGEIGKQLRGCDDWGLLVHTEEDRGSVLERPNHK